MSGPLRPTGADAWVVLAFVVGAVVEVVLRDGWGHDLALDAVGGAVLQVFLLLRRSRPLLAIVGYVGLAAAGTVMQTWLVPGGSEASFVPILALLVLTYSLGAHGSRRDLLVGCPLPLAMVVLVDLTDPSQGSLRTALPFFLTFVVLVPVLAGRAVRSRRHLVARLRDQEAALAAAHGQVLKEARMHEEVELHDQLDLVLGTGMARLLEQARAVRAGARGLAELENEARALLARTRESVVSLSQEPDPGPPAASAPPVAQVAEVAQPWAIVIAAGIGVGCLVELHSGARVFPGGLVLTAVLVSAVAMVWRQPIVATGVAWGAAVALGRVVTPYDASLTGIAVVVGSAFLVAWLVDRRAALLGLAVCGVGALAAMGTEDVLGRATFLLLSWGAGRLLRDHTLLLHRVQDAHRRREAARAAEVRATVLQQRAMAARELHDALGHSLTVVALQAGAARRIRDQDPEGALAALTVIEDVTRGGLDDLRGGLRTTWNPEGLIAAGRDAGHCLTVGGPHPPAAVAPVCQRVVQEAVTNVLRHAPGAAIDVRLAVVADRYRVQVTNGAPSGPAAAVPGGGNGLVGMRERVAAHGGICTWGPREDGGFRVRVELPIAEEDGA